jgi:hypothetical protein
MLNEGHSGTGLEPSQLSARNTEPCGADNLVRERFGEVFLR